MKQYSGRGMSIYPGEEPYYGTITKRQHRQLELFPEVLRALETLTRLMGDTIENNKIDCEIAAFEAALDVISKANEIEGGAK